MDQSLTTDWPKGQQANVPLTIGVDMSLRYARRMSRVQPSAIRELLRLGADPSIISFGGGYPDPALFPVEELQAVYSRLLVAELPPRCSTPRRMDCRGSGRRSPTV